MKFKGLVEEKSDGKIKVLFFPNAVSDSGSVFMESLQRGSIGLAASLMLNMAIFFRASRFSSCLTLPFPNCQQNVHKVIDLGGYLKKNANEDVLNLSCGLNTAAETLFPQSLLNLKNLAGIKMKTTCSPIEIKVAEVLGMNPAGAA